VGVVKLITIGFQALAARAIVVVAPDALPGNMEIVVAV
jgi:hypothetical protein